jgi:hypothetical protein
MITLNGLCLITVTVVIVLITELKGLEKTKKKIGIYSCKLLLARNSGFHINHTLTRNSKLHNLSEDFCYYLGTTDGECGRVDP